MEISVIIQFYERFVENHSLFYGPFIGGDNLVYRDLCKIVLYGSAKVIENKEDIRHNKNGFTIAKHCS